MHETQNLVVEILLFHELYLLGQLHRYPWSSFLMLHCPYLKVAFSICMSKYWAIHHVSYVVSYTLLVMSSLNTELDYGSTYLHSPKTMCPCRFLSPLCWASDLVCTPVMLLYLWQGILGSLDKSYTLDSTFSSRNSMLVNSSFHNQTLVHIWPDFQFIL